MPESHSPSWSLRATFSETSTRKEISSVYAPRSGSRTSTSQLPTSGRSRCSALGWLNRNRPNDALPIFGRLISEFMASIVDGVGALRSHAAAHGEGPDGFRVEPRHARLAVHAVHAVLSFLFETWQD